jgi:hypothetical protein
MVGAPKGPIQVHVFNVPIHRHRHRPLVRELLRLLQDHELVLMPQLAMLRQEHLLIS